MNTEQLKRDPMKETEQTLLDQIKDQVASKYGYKSWEILYGLRESKHAILKLMDEVAELHATAKAKASCEATLIKASENATVKFRLDYSLKFAYRKSIEIQKSSITDPNNITIV